MGTLWTQHGRRGGGLAASYGRRRLNRVTGVVEQSGSMDTLRHGPGRLSSNLVGPMPKEASGARRQTCLRQRVQAHEDNSPRLELPLPLTAVRSFSHQVKFTVLAPHAVGHYLTSSCDETLLKLCISVVPAHTPLRTAENDNALPAWTFQKQLATQHPRGMVWLKAASLDKGCYCHMPFHAT